MKGFKPTGYGPREGFHFPASHGFTGSTGNVTNVSPYTRRLAKPHIKPQAFAEGGYVRQTGSLDEGSSMVRRARSYNNADQESGGKTPLRPGYKKGGSTKKKVMKKADGGHVAQGSSNKGFIESLKKVPGLLKDALMSPKLASDPEKIISGRQRQIDRAVDEMSGENNSGKSNYARGGLAAGMAGPQRMMASPARMTTPRPPMRAMARSKGGRAGKTGMTKC